MSLRIRRGTDAQRQTLTFDQGEIVYTNDTKKLYVGDGITQGGVNILATSAGVGVTFNATTQAFDFSTQNLGITTSVVSEGSNKYFTTQRAQDAAASLFTSVGSPTGTGTITGTVATGSITVSVAPSNMVQGERFVVSGTGGNGLSAGTYYVVSVVSTTITLASSLANAMAGTAITSLTTGAITGTSYSAGGTDTGINFTYDSINHVMNVTASGVTSIINDTSPSLGGNLAIGNYNITSSGTGAISIAGGITTTGTITGGTVTGTTVNATTLGTAAIAVPDASLGLQIGTKLGNSFSVNYYNGTAGSPTSVSTGPSGMVVSIKGYTGTLYQFAGAVGAGWEVGANLSDSSPKSSVALISGAGGSGINQAILNSAGTLSANTIQTGSYAGSGLYPSPATAGMIIFDSSNSHFYGYNGTVWKQLDN